MSNFKNVLKVFKAMRDFDSDDHALLNTLRNATEADIELLIEAVGPVKRATKKPSKGAGKSRRAQGLGQQLVSSLESQRRLTTGNRGSYTDENACVYKFTGNGGKFCGSAKDSPIHDPAGGYSGYHEFVADTAKADDYQEQAGAVVGGG